MGILADTNVSRPVVVMLRGAGHDVRWIYEDAPRSADAEIPARAAREGRLLITFDTDFGEVAGKNRLPAPHGIVLFRIAEAVTEEETVKLIAHNLAAPVDWSGHLWVINIRKRTVSA